MSVNIHEMQNVKPPPKLSIKLSKSEMKNLDNIIFVKVGREDKKSLLETKMYTFQSDCLNVKILLVQKSHQKIIVVV